MSDHPRDPVRWRDRSDQSDPAERRAGHAVRCRRAMGFRPAPPLARVASRMRSARVRRRLTWVVVTATFLFGLGAAASAAYFNLLPDWRTIMRPLAPIPMRQSKLSRVKGSPAAPVSLAVAPLPSHGPAPLMANAAPVVGGSPIPATHRPGLAFPSASTVHGPSATRKTALLDTGNQYRRAVEPGPEANRPTSPSSTSIPSPKASAPPDVARPSAALKADSVANVAPTAWPDRITARGATPAVQPGVSDPSPGPQLGLSSPSSVPSQAPAGQGAGGWLTEVIHLLRAEHAPGTALQLLDRHAGELAQSGLGHEALILRVEASLALGRRLEVLRLLDEASLTDVAASRALLVTRGQLRSAVHRCAEGIGDFDMVLARSRQTDQQALIGRALCRAQLGDLAAMRADVERLHKEFPNQALPAELEK